MFFLTGDDFFVVTEDPSGAASFFADCGIIKESH